jgi:ribonuclease VapC
MIVIDSSALIAIAFAEPEKEAFEAIVAGPERCLLSAVNAYETAIVLRMRWGHGAIASFRRMLEDNGIEIVPFDGAQVLTAAEAYGRYGKGIHAKARLNLADCAAYALAKVLDAPLLFKGDDFIHTDVKLCA